MTHRLIILAVLMLAAALLVACSHTPSLNTDGAPAGGDAGEGQALPSPLVPELNTYCSLVGCANALTVQLSGDIPSVYTVTLVPKDGVSYSLTCRTDETLWRQPFFCHGDKARFRDLTPKEATIVVEWDGGAMMQVVRPTYEEYMPNGPGCPPTCRAGSVVIEVR